MNKDILRAGVIAAAIGLTAACGGSEKNTEPTLVPATPTPSASSEALEPQKEIPEIVVEPHTYLSEVQPLSLTLPENWLGTYLYTDQDFGVPYEAFIPIDLTTDSPSSIMVSSDVLLERNLDDETALRSDYLESFDYKIEEVAQIEIAGERAMLIKGKDDRDFNFMDILFFAKGKAWLVEVTAGNRNYDQAFEDTVLAIMGSIEILDEIPQPTIVPEPEPTSTFIQA